MDIKNTSNEDLILIYKYSLLHRFMLLGRIQGYWHPTYKHNSVSVPTNRFMLENTIYSIHEMTLLNEMWERYTKGTFCEMCWWQSKKLFQTKISLPRTKSEIIEPSVIKETKPTQFIIYKNEKYEYLSSGSKRKTYVSKDKSYVIKVPMKPTKLGIEENLKEAKVYSEKPNTIYAKCELIENDLLKMEYVEPVFFTMSDDYPDWITQIAEAQVGYNNDGVLVAYDYGSEI